MKRIFFLLFIFFAINSSCIASVNEANWEYVLTRNGIVYSVDMNNVNISTENIFTFWLATDDKSKNNTVFMLIAVRIKEHECRYEEAYQYEMDSRKLISREIKPGNWQRIPKNSPMEIAINYIIDKKVGRST